MNYSVIAQLKSKSPSATQGTIIIRAFHNRQPVIAKSTGHRIDKEYWDIEKRKVKLQAPNAHLINAVIEKQLQQIQATILQKELMGGIINRQHIMEAVRGNNNRDFISYCLTKIEGDYKSPETKRMMKGLCAKLKKYRPGISFSDIDYRFLQLYQNYMRDELLNCENTIWSSMKFLKTMLNKAFKEGGIISVNPFTNFSKTRYVNKPQPHMLIEDCNAIEKMLKDDAIDPLLKSVAVRFLLMCYSGMRFSDAMRFSAIEHIQGGRLIMNYNKFSERVNYQVYHRLAEIAAIVINHPLGISNTDFNRKLKTIAGICRIRVKLSSKVGRHTLGYLLADKDVPEEKAQKILGHRDRRSTRIYYHIDEKQVDREVMKLDSM